MKKSIIMIAATSGMLGFNTPAMSSSFLCSSYAESTEDAFTNGGEITSKTDHGLNQVTMLAIGAYLAVKKIPFSKAGATIQGDAFKNFYSYCLKHPDELAVDAAVNASLNETITQLDAADVDKTPPTKIPAKITADEIAKGLSRKKTELEQEAWWDEKMAGKTYQLTGKVTEVEKGTFSGYWVNLDIGKNIMVRCGMSSEWEDVVKKIKKGQQFSCTGEVSSTWTSVFGITFRVDAV
ncbi:hypothetical protein [Brucella rhizosphaerae]|uniref:hypothetical protein n=1 Tax=Brucella rhizosphaerae TaxID=571254 RepID=UPI0012686EFA|nr:hypothetical protein [Brucella rhizosphaerae]